MGISRYSRDPHLKRWQEKFDELQARCRQFDGSPTIGELTGHGIAIARWECRSLGWRGIGEPCWHHGETFELTRFGAKMRVCDLRRHYVCSSCGRDRPQLELLWVG